MNKGTMCSRLMSLGLPKSSSHQLVELIGVWQNCSGQEWTVKRLKEVKLIYLHRLAGSKFTPSCWIKTRNGVPTGPLSVLFKMNDKKLSKVLTALTSYSVYVSNQVTETQKKKFFESMESWDEKGLDSKMKQMFSFPQDRNPKPPSLWEYSASSSKRAPSSDGLKSVREDNIRETFLHGAMSNTVRQIVARYDDYFRQVIPIDLFFNIEPHPRDKEESHSLGRISAIQEPGYKLRAIANPSRVLQAALEPLKDLIQEVLSGVETDCTLDQMSAVKPVQQWLQEGRTVYSVDLSDATNLFPWPVQRELLYDSVPESFYPLVDIMDFCATNAWTTSLRTGVAETVFFSRGQPLGLGPSFHTFALAHNTLLKGICEKHGIEPRFRVLGDDVVISDKKLHRIYRSSLYNLGCKISESKTFASKHMAEFAGITILPNRIGHGFKWRSVSDHSFVSLVQNLGKSSLGMLTPRQRDLIKVLGPIPKEYGGCGWSDGLKLTDFLCTPTGGALIKHLTAKMYEDRAVCFRDLTAELRIFLSEFGGELTTPLHQRFMSASSWRQLDVSSFLDSELLITIPTTAVRPFEVISDMTQLSALRAKGYYPIPSRAGDPRPNPTVFIEKIKKLIEEEILNDNFNLQIEQSVYDTLDAILKLPSDYLSEFITPVQSKEDVRNSVSSPSDDENKVIKRRR